MLARKEQARAAATAAAEKVNHDIQSAKDTATRNWNAVRAKVTADINTLKADVAHKKHDLDAKLAENHASRLESEAGFAIDYAIASVEPSRLSKPRHHDITLGPAPSRLDEVRQKNPGTPLKRPDTIGPLH